MPANLENSAVATRLKKVSFHSSPAKESSTFRRTVLISQASKLMLKSLQARFQRNKLDFKKAEEPEIKLPTSTGYRKADNSRETSTSASLTTQNKALTLCIITNC